MNRQTYAAQPGPYQEKALAIYDELRKNVVNNVVKVYHLLGADMQGLNFCRSTNERVMYGNSMTRSQGKARGGAFPVYVIFKWRVLTALLATHSLAGHL